MVTGFTGGVPCVETMRGRAHSSGGWREFAGVMVQVQSTVLLNDLYCTWARLPLPGDVGCCCNFEDTKDSETYMASPTEVDFAGGDELLLVR